jgi:hypothetical protein
MSGAVMRKSASEYQAGSAQPFHGPDIEYRLGPRYRRPALVRFLITAALTVVFAVSGLPILSGAAAISGAFALCFGVSYVWRGRFRTRVTSRGIEVRGYFNHIVPWEQVRDIEVSEFGADRMPLNESVETAQYMPRAGVNVTTYRRTATRMSVLASISVVRAGGRKVKLRAPLVSGWAADPDFDDKARQLEQLCVRYGRGAIS